MLALVIVPLQEMVHPAAPLACAMLAESRWQSVPSCALDPVLYGPPREAIFLPRFQGVI